MDDIDLTIAQRAALRAAIATYADRFDRIGVYGSRADGTALPGSDVDLVIFGADEGTVADLRRAIEESDLSIFADLVRFESINDQRFAGVVASQARKLFEGVDFRLGLA